MRTDSLRLGPSRILKIAASLVCVGVFLFPYFNLEGTWWRFIPSTLVILGVGVLVTGRSAAELFGLVLTKRDLALSVALFVLTLVISHYTLSELVGRGDLTIHREASSRWQVHGFFQVFNDEILMRAALLTVVLRAFPHPKIVIGMLSLVFSLGHRFFYGLDGIEISATALLTLFAFGVIANTLFVHFRHIGFGFALHYAWNFWRFNSSYYLNGRPLPEGATFNYVEGNAWIAVTSVLAMLCVFAAYLRSGRQRWNGSDA